MQHIVLYLYQLNNEICRPAHIIIHFLSAQLINSANGKHAASNISQPQRKTLTTQPEAGTRLPTTEG